MSAILPPQPTKTSGTFDRARPAGGRWRELRCPVPSAQGTLLLVEIRPIDVLHPGDFAAWFAVYDAADKYDLPRRPRWLERELRVRHESTDFLAATLWLAEDAGVAIGAGVAGLPLKDNQRLAEVEVFVRPEMRRRGIGTALLRELAEHAAAHGRTALLTAISGTRAGEPTPGTAFAEAHGFTRRMTEAWRVQRPPFQLGRLAELEAEAMRRADGYRLVVWRGRIPDEWVIEYARLAGRMTTDAPAEELEYEPEAWDPGRVRNAEVRRARMGRDWWCTVAVAPDGTLAGMTDISLAVDDDRSAFHGDTIVDSAHRGHRLGLLLKVTNLRAVLADRPGVQAIWTWNAASNRFMISINEQLGYALAGWSAMYQRD